jgi:hypothetical protein
MKSRAKSRNDCEVTAEWLVFLTFKAWALANGYADNMALCRTGDAGNYEPNNVRWDTRGNNQVEDKALHYQFVHSGQLIEVYNLQDFCRKNKLSVGNMSRVHSQQPNNRGSIAKLHKGYTKYLQVNRLRSKA